MQSLHHISELFDRAERILPRAVGLMRREERNRCVAPVVDHAGRAILRIELKHGQQLYGGNPELLQIRDLLSQASIRPTKISAESGSRMAREAANVHLIN